MKTSKDLLEEQNPSNNTIIDILPIQYWYLLKK